MAVFVDTGAWFAYFVRRDPDHRAAIVWMQQNRQPLVTTDYVLDELLTLLKMRENYRISPPFPDTFPHVTLGALSTSHPAAHTRPRGGVSAPLPPCQSHAWWFKMTRSMSL
jgi:hypothetical protein